VRELRQKDYPPERVLVSIKELLTDAGIRRTGPLADRGSSTADPETDIVDCVVTWCIEEYFRVAPKAD
jgi:hypothetical protein